MKYFRIAACTILLISISACSSARLSSPTLTPTAAVAAMPLSTDTLAATPTGTNTPIGTAVPNGPCDNPLVPLGKSNQWTYRVTSAGGETLFSLASTGSQPGAQVAQVVFSDQKNNFTVTKPVTCKDGAIVDYPLLVLNMLFSDYLSTFFSATQKTGDYAPNYQSLTRNDWILNWQAGYLTENDAAFQLSSGNAGLDMPPNTLIELSSSMIGVREAVSVPAGDFPQALKITQDVSMPVIFTGGGSGAGDSLKIMITQWYEPYVGLVRAEITSVTMRVTQSFPHFFYDLPIESKLELMEFKPGK